VSREYPVSVAARPIILLGVILATVAAFGPRASAQAESKPVPYWRVEQILPSWFSSRGPAREKIFEQLKALGYDRVLLTKTESERVAKLVRSAPAKPTAPKAGAFTTEHTVRGEKLTILGAVPKKYDGKRRVPLVISLHGGGSDTHKNLPEATRAAEGEIRYWTKGCEDVGAILIAPTTTDEYWAVDRGREIILGALRYACEHYEIDTDRVLLTGSSLGGFGTFWWAPVLADRFALAAPFIGGPDVRDRLGNCRNLPMHVMIGSLDPMMYMKEWVRDDVAELKKLGYEVVFHEHPQLGHHVPDEECPQVLAKLLKSPRNLCAKRLTRTFGGGMWYWIEAEGKLEATLAGNTITITGPKAGRVLLSEAMVDLDKPVRVELNGAVKFEGKVERSLGLMIDQLRDSLDPNRAFCTSIEVR